MNGKMTLACLCMMTIAAFSFATDYEECFKLNESYNLSTSAVHEQIVMYELRLKQDKNDYYANLAIAILYTVLASPMENPEDGASGKIIPYTAKFEAKEKNNSLELVYSGMGHSLMARDSKNMFVKLAEVSKAISIFDRNVKLSENKPIEWYVRYMRGNFYMNLPDSLNKHKDAEQDFAFVLQQYHKNPALEGYMADGYYYLGEIEKSRGNIDKAMEYWKLSVAINERLKLNSKEADKSMNRLKTFED